MKQIFKERQAFLRKMKTKGFSFIIKNSPKQGFGELVICFV